MAEGYLESTELPDEPVTASALSVRDVVAAVRQRWPLAVAVAALVLGVGVWHTMHEPLVYSAATTVRIQQNRAPLANMQTSAPAYDYRVDALLSEQQIIKSRMISERVAQALGLRLVPVKPAVSRHAIFGELPPVVDSLPTVQEIRLSFGDAAYSMSSGNVNYGTQRYGTPISGGGITVTVPAHPAIDAKTVVLAVVPLEDAAGLVRGSIDTKAIPQTNIVEISFKGGDPYLVRDAANTIARTYAEFSAETQQQNAKAKSRFIAQSLQSQEQQLSGAQDQMRSFKEREQIGDADAEMQAVFTSIHSLEDQQQAAVVEQKVYQALLGKLTAADTVDEELRRLVGTDAVEKNSYIANLYSRWFDLSKQREELLADGRTPANPDVKAVDRLITRTKQDLQSASQQYLVALQSRLSSLNQTIADLRTRAEKFPPLEAEQARLSANVKTMQTMYDALQEQYQLARISEQADGGTVQLIDEASLPSFAISPNRRRAALYSLMMGIILGIGLVVLLERLDDTVKTPDELQTKLDIPVLGLIPAINLQDLGHDRSPQPALGRLVTHADPRSPVAEAYRSIRTNLAFARAHQQVKTIVVASPGPGDGKSTTVANLAITFAQQGQRVLLIDADMRRAVLDKTFEVPRSPGLTDVLVGNIDLAKAANETRVPNLFVLGSGQFPPNPSELLGSQMMRDTLREAQQLFDVVLFDTPPLLAVTDAAVLSTMVDGTILVVRTMSTAREAVRRAAGQLRAVHGRLLGAVLNDVDFRVVGYYGGYGYYYHSYYGDAGINGSSKGTNGNGNGHNGLAGRYPGLARRLRQFTPWRSRVN